ncbi:MAG: hypothetical protein H6739_29150 [Alphaproteobacteria bacterium]|nr:hypothetical protein [Alphaproteobacteria bacterium]
MSQEKGRSYFVPQEIRGELFDLSHEKKDPVVLAAAMRQLRSYVQKYRDDFLGYQSTARLDTAHLADFVQSAINNIGDSFANPKLTTPGATSQLADGFFSLNSKWVERAVLDYFARLWNAPSPRKVYEDRDEGWEDSYWGYVLSMGSTEGNLMALRSARDYLRGRKLEYDERIPTMAERLGYVECEEPENPEFKPVLLFSEASHYSVKKLAYMLDLEYQFVKVNPDGSMNLDHLVDLAVMAMRIERRPPAILFNYGTTWTGALDDVAEGVRRLKEPLERYGFDWRTIKHGDKDCRRRGFWIHVDGALGAGYASVVQRDGDFELPGFDFSHDIQSLAMSGHKWPGAPWPTGIYMTRNRYMLTNDVPNYVGALDSTLAGSRNGAAAIFLWDWVARNSLEERAGVVKGQLDLARRTLKVIQQVWDPDAWRAPGSVMIIMKRPKDETVRRYALACNNVNNVDLCHLVFMPHVGEGVVGRLLRDLRAEKEAGDTLAAAAFSDDGRGGW